MAVFAADIAPVKRGCWHRNWPGRARMPDWVRSGGRTNY